MGGKENLKFFYIDELLRLLEKQFQSNSVNSLNMEVIYF